MIETKEFGPLTLERYNQLEAMTTRELEQVALNPEYPIEVYYWAGPILTADDAGDFGPDCGSLAAEGWYAKCHFMDDRYETGSEAARPTMRECLIYTIMMLENPVFSA